MDSHVNIYEGEQHTRNKEEFLKNWLVSSDTACVDDIKQEVKSKDVLEELAPLYVFTHRSLLGSQRLVLVSNYLVKTIKIVF